MRPSSKWISLGCHVWLWSKPARSGFDGFLERLNQSRSGSSSGIHSLTARQGGSMRSRLSISKGGGGGRGKCTTPSQSPCRRRKNSTSSQRSTGRMIFIVPWQQGHSRGSPPQTCRMRSRHKGRMSRALRLGGGATSRSSPCIE